MEKRTITAEDLLVMMRAVGVDAALLTNPSVYGSNHAYSFAAAARYPTKFGVVGPVSPKTPGIETYVRTFRERAGGIGVRLVFPDASAGAPTDSDYSGIYRAAKLGCVPIFIAAPGQLPAVAEIARRNSDVTFVVDHFGHSGPSFDAVPELVNLAQFENVAIKCTSAPSFSREPYPFLDIWPVLEHVFEAFGLDRVMWGTDITRVEHYTYCEGLSYLRNSDRLTDAEKEVVLGASLRRVLRWPA
jgi:L-fuconolactonase